MVIVDFILGPKAEFLNAFSVMQRLIGQQTTTGKSMIANTFGTVGELAVVIIVNIIIGVLLTFIMQLFLRRKYSKTDI